MKLWRKILMLSDVEKDTLMLTRQTPVAPLIDTAVSHGRRKDFFQWAKVVKLGFYLSKLKKQPFLLIISKSKGGAWPP